MPPTYAYGPRRRAVDRKAADAAAHADIHLLELAAHDSLNTRRGGGCPSFPSALGRTATWRQDGGSISLGKLRMEALSEDCKTSDAPLMTR